MALARIDEQHLAHSNLALGRSVVKLEPTLRDDQGDRNGIAMLWNFLTRLQPQSDDAQRSAIGDLLETKGVMRPTRSNR